MDHKVSKDMISSGMIPSGEKTQADLGKTQYGSAPSPSKLMDAYKSMYGNKEEVINEMAGKGMGMTPAPKPSGGMAKRVVKKIDPETTAADRVKPTPKTDSRMDQVKRLGFAKSYRQIGPKSETEDMQDRLTDRKIERKVDKDMKRDRLKKIMADNESVDLLAAYRSIYEHHKKDADGNTIPHEGEELNEAIPLIGAALAGAGKLVAGLGAKAAATGAGKAMAGAAAKKGLGAAAKKGTMMVGKQLGGTQGARIGAKAADAFGKMDNFSKLQTVSMAKDTVGSTLNAVNPLKKRVGGTGGGGGVTGGMSQTVSAGADLFDIVKAQLLDEGLSEEEITDIMLTLTPDEIMKEMNQGPSTPVKNYGDSPDKPKILPNFGATRAKPRTTDKGTLIKGGKDTGKTPAQMSQEEYKNFDPKKPDPKQMAAQAKQEKIRQKNSDPMGVKNRNIGGQGLDPMDK